MFSLIFMAVLNQFDIYKIVDGNKKILMQPDVAISFKWSIKAYPLYLCVITVTVIIHNYKVGIHMKETYTCPLLTSNQHLLSL